MSSVTNRDELNISGHARTKARSIKRFSRSSVKPGGCGLGGGLVGGVEGFDGQLLDGDVQRRADYGGDAEEGEFSLVRAVAEGDYDVGRFRAFRLAARVGG
jgi:hypothetical protein